MHTYTHSPVIHPVHPSLTLRFSVSSAEVPTQMPSSPTSLADEDDEARWLRVWRGLLKANGAGLSPGANLDYQFPLSSKDIRGI